MKEFSPTESFCLLFQTSGRIPHLEHFKLNPSLAAFSWHGSINLDCESIWGPACGCEVSGEFVYLFTLNTVPDSKQAGLLVILFVWQDYSSVLWFCIYMHRFPLLCSLDIFQRRILSFPEFGRNPHDESKLWCLIIY